MHATKVTTLNFNENVQFVLQDTAILSYDVHPFVNPKPPLLIAS